MAVRRTLRKFYGGQGFLKVKMGSGSVGRWIATDQMADWLISEAYPIDDP